MARAACQRHACFCTPGKSRDTSGLTHLVHDGDGAQAHIRVRRHEARQQVRHRAPRQLLQAVRQRRRVLQHLKNVPLRTINKSHRGEVLRC